MLAASCRGGIDERCAGRHAPEKNLGNDDRGDELAHGCPLLPLHADARVTTSQVDTATPPASSRARKAAAIMFCIMDLRASAVVGPATGERKAGR